MVGCSEQYLFARFRKVGRELQHRRRVEKMRPYEPNLYRDRLLAAERSHPRVPVRRILFDNFQSKEANSRELNNFIASELAKSDDDAKNKWNFDFRAGVPANVPGHRIQWVMTEKSADAAAGATEDAIATSSRSTAEAECSNDAVAEEKENRSSESSTTKSSAVRNRRQALITEYLPAAKNAKMDVKSSKVTVINGSKPSKIIVE